MPALNARDHSAERGEALEVVPGEEAVDEGQGCAHPARERLVLRTPLERVHPDDRVRGARQAGHLAADQIGILAFPPVRADDDDRATRQGAPPPIVVELLEGPADPRPSGPVDDACRGGGERMYRVAGDE